METYTEELGQENDYYEEDERILYKDSTYDIVSKVAYLIGVPKHIFENEHEPPKLEIYELLEKDKSARIIRNLSVVRAAIERRFGKINDKIRKEAVDKVVEFARSIGFNPVSLIESPIVGGDGNIEFLAHFQNGESI